MSQARCIQLWSGPRNVSTALMYSFAQRSDMAVLDEPLYAYYLRETGIDHPGKEEILAAHEADGEVVIDQMLHNDRSEPYLFCKQMGHHLVDLSTDWLEECENIFLIRHPGEVINSFSKVIPNPTLRDIGIAHQWELFQQLQARGHRPIVLEGNEILKNPKKVLSAACEQLGIGFDAAMLSWEAGARPEDGVWAKYWYSRVHTSTGFAAYVPKSQEVRPDLVPLLEEAMPAYEALLAHAIHA